MKSARTFESRRVLVCDSAMLPQVLRPRFHHKILDVPTGLRGIREQAPEYRPVTEPDRSQRVHGVSKVCGCTRVDLVFDGDHHRVGIRLDFAGYLRVRHETLRF